MSKIPTVSASRRFWNVIIDQFIIILIVLILIAIVASADTLELLINHMVESSDEIIGAYSFLFFNIYFLYYSLEILTGRTIGKILTKSKVVSNNGSPASLVKVINRTLCRLIPLEALTFLGSKPIDLHDKLSKTLVVDISHVNKDYSFQKRVLQTLLYFIIYILIVINFIMLTGAGNDIIKLF